MAAMAALLLPPFRRAPGADDPEGPVGPPPRVDLAAAAAVAALRAALLGLLPVAVLVILGWAAAERSASAASDAVRAAGQVWLLAHHVPLSVPGGTLGLAPLGLTALPATLLVLAGRRIARATPAAPAGAGRELVLPVAVLAGTYGVAAAAVALLSATEPVRAGPLAALGAATLLAGCAGTVGAVGGASGARGLLRRRVPAPVRAAVAGALAGVGVLLAGGALLGAVALALRVDRAVALSQAVDPGVVGGLLLVVLGAGLVPNAAVWGAAVAVGPGFAVGEGTSVTAAAADLGPVPALPLLAALPDSGPAPPPLLGVLLLPVVAGVLVALVALRRRPALGIPPTGVLRTSAAAAAAGVLAGTLLALLAVLAGGPLGGGRLSAVGPSPWRVWGAASTELAGVAAAVTYLRLRARVPLSRSVRPLLRRLSR
jgi:Family of unknown function (DUF6350)